MRTRENNHLQILLECTQYKFKEGQKGLTKITYIIKKTQSDLCVDLGQISYTELRIIPQFIN